MTSDTPATRPTDRELADSYARLYGPLAVVMLLTFFPYMQDRVDESGNVVLEFGSLWQESFGSGGDTQVASLGMVLFVATIVLVLIAAFVKPPSGLTAAIALLALIIAIMVLTRPGFYAMPPLTDAGIADVAIGFAVALTAIVQTTHLVLRRLDRNLSG